MQLAARALAELRADLRERFGRRLAWDVQVELTQSVLPGLREAIELMVEGEKRRCWIPGWLAFGEANPGAADDGKPRGMLVYDLDLVNLRKAVGLPKAPPDVAAVPDDATKSESGLAWQSTWQCVRRVRRPWQRMSMSSLLEATFMA